MDFIWTGLWPDAVQFMNACGYHGPYMGLPAIHIAEGALGPGGTLKLNVVNLFTMRMDQAEVGDLIRWYQSTKTFSIIR